MAPYAQVPREDGTRVALGAAYSIVLFVYENLRFFIHICVRTRIGRQRRMVRRLKLDKALDMLFGSPHDDIDTVLLSFAHLIQKFP